MQRETFLRLMRVCGAQKCDDVFQFVRSLYDAETAIQALELLGFDDTTVFRAVRRAYNNRQEADQALLTSWNYDRLKLAKPRNKEFTQFIGLNGDGELKYRIAFSVSVDNGIADVWFHHVDTGVRYSRPEDCISWSSLSPEDEAMWTLLVSKIESLPNEYYVEAARICNSRLIVPYENIDESDEGREG